MKSYLISRVESSFNNGEELSLFLLLFLIALTVRMFASKSQNWLEATLAIMKMCPRVCPDSIGLHVCCKYWLIAYQVFHIHNYIQQVKYAGYHLEIGSFSKFSMKNRKSSDILFF